MRHLEGISLALLLQHPRLKDLPDEALGVVNGVLGVSFGLLGCFMSNEQRRASEGDAARDAQPALFICDHLHSPAARVKDAHRAEGRAEVQSDDFRFGRRQVLLAQVPGQKQGQDRGTCGERTSHSRPADWLLFARRKA